ncbi:MAG: hypothetical protein U0802_14020 [Candidatus Binatia bacterium]
MYDTVAQVLPLLRRCTDAPLLFYGHYPDALLARTRRGPRSTATTRLAVRPLEGVGLDAADRLLVNSAFTAAAFRRVSTIACGRRRKCSTRRSRAGRRRLAAAQCRLDAGGDQPSGRGRAPRGSPSRPWRRCAPASRRRPSRACGW